MMWPNFWIQNRFLNSKTLQTITHFPNTNLLNHSSFFFFSFFFITFIYQQQCNSKSNSFHIFQELQSGHRIKPFSLHSKHLWTLSFSSSNTFLLPLQFVHGANQTSPQLSQWNPFNPKHINHPPNSKPSQAKSSPTQPETHWWFDQRGLMIGEAFIWWFDRRGLMIGDNGWSAWFDDRQLA